MGEAIFYGTEKTDDEKFDWNAAFNNSVFISHILDVPTIIDYTGSETFIPDYEYFSRIDIGTAHFPSCSGYIGSHAFDGCKNMKSIRFTAYGANPDNLQYIGEYAFINCKNLNSVSFQFARNISAYAFTMLYNLQSLYMQSIYYSDPDKVKTNIGSHAFELCTRFDLHVDINTVRNIGAYAFADCRMYSNYTGTYYCNNIGYRAYNNCYNISSISFNTMGYYSSNYSNNKLIIGDEVFSGCTMLSYISVCNLVKIGKSAFKNLSYLTSIYNYVHYSESSKSTILDYLTYIDEDAFYGCNSLYISLYNNIPYIDTICRNAFYNCKSVLNTPGSYLCGKVLENAFYGCDSLTNVTLNNYGYRLLSDAGVSLSCILYSKAFNGADSISYISINNIKYIHPYMFTNRSSLQTITLNNIDMYYLSNYIYLPSEKMNIGSHAFESCYNLSTAYISLVNEIGECAFADCSLLSYASIGCSLCTKVGSSAFKNCTSISYIVLNNYFSSYSDNSNRLFIYDSAFENCTKLSYMYIWGLSYISDNALKGCISLNTLYISSPLSNLQIGDNLLVDCSNLSYLSINGISRINKNLISNCSNLTNIVDMIYCSYIESSTFYNFSKLLAVSIGAAVTSIGVYIDDYAFTNCISITTANIPLRYVGSHAFENCYNLEYVTHAVLSNVNIGEYAFCNCSQLITVNGGFRSIGSHAFENCSQLRGVNNGPACCEYIGEYAFHNCSYSGFYSIFFIGQSTLSYIGSHAFDNVTNLSCININMVSSIPHLVSIDAFNNINSSYTIIVPESLYSYFITDSIWGLISDHITI